MNETEAFERVRDHARAVESMYRVTVIVDESTQEVTINGAGGECPESLDMLNMGGVLGRASVVEIEDGDDAISLIDGVINGAKEELTFNSKGTLIRSKFLFNDGAKYVRGRVGFSRGRRTEVIDYLPYARRGS